MMKVIIPSVFLALLLVSTVGSAVSPTMSLDIYSASGFNYTTDDLVCRYQAGDGDSDPLNISVDFVGPSGDLVITYENQVGSFDGTGATKPNDFFKVSDGYVTVGGYQDVPGDYKYKGFISHSNSTNDIDWNYIVDLDSVTHAEMYEMGVLSNGDIAVAGKILTSDGILYYLNSTGSYEWNWTDTTSKCYGLGVDGDDNISIGCSNFYRYNNTGGLICSQTYTGQIYSVDVNETGYSAVTGSGGTILYDPNCNALWTYASATGGRQGTLTYDLQGNILVQDDSITYKLNSSGGLIWSYSADTVLEKQIRVDGTNNVWYSTWDFGPSYGHLVKLRESDGASIHNVSVGYQIGEECFRVIEEDIIICYEYGGVLQLRNYSLPWYYDELTSAEYGPVTEALTIDSADTSVGETWKCYAGAYDGSNTTQAYGEVVINLELAVSYVDPTPENVQISGPTAYINVTTNKAALNCTLEWLGVNETMLGSGTNFYANKTNLTHGNYTYEVYCNSSLGETKTAGARWVYTTFYVPPEASRSWCYEGLYLYTIEVENQTVNGTSTFTTTESVEYCRYGCGEGTNPNGDECYQAPIITVTSAFTILIVFLALIFILPYTLKKRKKKGR